MVTRPQTSIWSPSRGINATFWARIRNITQRNCAASSFNEKYQSPLAARAKFEISPLTQTRGKSSSRCALIARVSAETETTVLSFHSLISGLIECLRIRVITRTHHRAHRRVRKAHPVRRVFIRLELIGMNIGAHG